MDIYRIAGNYRLDPETGVKQYLNTPSGYMASSPENELFIYEDLTEWFGLFLIKVYSVIMTKKSRELKVYFTPGRNHIPYSPIIKTTYVDKQNNLWIKSQRSFIKNVLSAQSLYL